MLMRPAFRWLSAGVLVAAVSCGQEPTSGPPPKPPPQVVPAPKALAFFTGAVGVDPNDGSGGVDLPAFSDYAIVDITVSGLITQHNDVTGTTLVYGPRGLPNCEVGGYTIVYGGVLALPAFPCSSSNFADPTASGRAVVIGAGRADRSAGPSCDGCYTYSGSQTVTVTEVPVTVAVRSDFSQAPAGSSVTFTSTIDPQEMSFGGWWFFMDNGFTYQACPSSNRTTCTMQLFGPGHMEMYANYGPLARVATARVDVGPPVPSGGGGSGSGGAGGNGAGSGNGGGGNSSLTVEIDYPPGTPLLTGSAQFGNAPMILPDSLISNRYAIGSPPRLGTFLWPDHLDVIIRVHRDGTPLAGQHVTVEAAAIDDGGRGLDVHFGHIHSSVSASPKSPGTLSAHAVISQQDGTALVRYKPSIVSGPVVLHATLAGASPAVDTVIVGVPGLVPLEPAESFDTVGTTTTHPSASWVVPEMRPLLVQLADTFMHRFHHKLKFNDASLPYGGKFDLLDQWANAASACRFAPQNGPRRETPWGCHALHRIGRDIDLHTISDIHDIGLTDAERNFIRQRWLDLSGGQAGPEADHWHLYFRR